MPVLSPRPIHWYHRVDGRPDFDAPAGSIVITVSDRGPERLQPGTQEPFRITAAITRLWIRRGMSPDLSGMIEVYLKTLTKAGEDHGLECGTLYGVVLASELISAQIIREVTTIGPGGGPRVERVPVRDNVLGLDSVPNPIEAITVALLYSNADLEPRFTKHPEFGSISNTECTSLGLPVYPNIVAPPREVRNRFQREPVI